MEKQPKVLFACQLGDERPVWDVASNEVRMWAYMLKAQTYCPPAHSLWDLDYYRQFDLIIVERPNCDGFIMYLASHGLPVISLEEGPLNINISDNGISGMVQLWKNAPVIGAINSEIDVPIIQSFTDKPVISMTPAIPIDYLDSIRISPISKQDRYVEVWTAGHGPQGTLRSLFNMAVMHRRPQYKYVVYTHVSTLEQDTTFMQGLGLRNVEIRPAIGWHEHAREHAQAWVTLNLDTRLSACRISRDSAGLGIPAIGNIVNHTQYSLFGLDTSIDVYQIEKACKLLDQLMADDLGENSHYLKIANEAIYAAKERYSVEALTAKFWKDLKAVKPEWIKTDE